MFLTSRVLVLLISRAESSSLPCLCGPLVLSVQVMHHLAMKEHPRAAEDSELKGNLQSVSRELQDPTQFKAKLNELQASLVMQDQHALPAEQALPRPTEPSMHRLAEHLSMQQNGIDFLVQLIEDDAQRLSIMEKGWSQSPRR